jgi:hypothetical protein
MFTERKKIKMNNLTILLAFIYSSTAFSSQLEGKTFQYKIYHFLERNFDSLEKNFKKSEEKKPSEKDLEESIHWENKSIGSFYINDNELSLCTKRYFTARVPASIARQLSHYGFSKDKKTNIYKHENPKWYTNLEQLKRNTKAQKPKQTKRKRNTDEQTEEEDKYIKTARKIVANPALLDDLLISFFKKH